MRAIPTPTGSLTWRPVGGRYTPSAIPPPGDVARYCAAACLRVSVDRSRRVDAEVLVLADRLAPYVEPALAAIARDGAARGAPEDKPAVPLP
jgi:hypothetical protein